VADGVGRQFVNGEDDIARTTRGQPGPAGMRQHLGSQDVERAGIERLVKAWRRAVGTMIIGHAFVSQRRGNPPEGLVSMPY
jgi:hypothetical protein